MTPVLSELFKKPTSDTRRRDVDGHTGSVRWSGESGPYHLDIEWSAEQKRLLIHRWCNGSPIRSIRVPLDSLSGGAIPAVILERAQMEVERKWSVK